MLSWAPAAIGAPPVQKTIRVMNNGCAAAQLTWALVHLPDPDRPLQANAAVDDYGKVRLAVGRPEYEPIEPGHERFSVSPAVDRDARGRDISVSIDKGKDRSFAVSFDPREAGISEACLVAYLRHPTEVPLPGGGSSQQHPELVVRLRADTIGPRLEMSERLKLKFKVYPNPNPNPNPNPSPNPNPNPITLTLTLTLTLTQVSPVDPPSHPAYTRCLTMRNPASTTLQFRVHVPPPFVLLEARCSTSQPELLGNLTVDDASLLTLPPSESVQLVLQYVPEKKRRRRSGGDGGSASGDDATSVGGGDDAQSVASARTATSRGSALTAKTGATVTPTPRPYP